MIQDINYYRAISNATGCNTKTETQKAQIKRRLKRDFENPLDVVSFNFYNTNNDIRLEIHAQKFSETMGQQQKFKSLITASLSHGDTLYNSVDNTYWLCTESRLKNDLYYSGTMTQCNWILKWQDENRQIIEKPAIVLSASQYNSGEEKTKTLTLGANQVMVYMILDDDTVKLKSDKRFFIDNNRQEPKPYNLTRCDTVTKSYMGVGRICLVCTEDQFNVGTDNKELMICNYTTPPPVDVPHITYSGDAIIRNGGIKSFAIETDEVITWSVEYADSDDNYLQLTVIDNNHCKLKCISNDTNVGKQFSVKAVGLTVNVSVNITVIGGL